MKNKKNIKKKRFNIFDMNRNGKGVEKDEIMGPPNFKNFFKNFGRKFYKLLSLNLLMWGRFPLYALIIGMVSYLLYNLGGVFEIISATISSLLGVPLQVSLDPLYGTALGSMIASGKIHDNIFMPSSPSATILYTIYGGAIEMPTFSPLFFGVIIGLAIFVFLTWGWQNIGSTYITRGMFRGDPVFIFSDYFHGIKKNFRQGFFLGLIDAFIILLLTFDLCWLFISSTSILSEILLFITSGMIILYFIMRKYIYLLAITFDIKISKIMKNALIFTVLGIKRNLVGTLGSIVLLAVNIAIGILCLNINFIIPLLLPLVYFIASDAYISTYAVYPVIEKYMITPYSENINVDQ